MDETCKDPPPGGTHIVTIICSADPELAKPVRDFVAAILALHGDADVCDSGRLICSELYGNSVRHVPGARTEVSVHRDEDRPALVIAVADDHPSMPESRDPRTEFPFAESGRGLALVSALSEECGAVALSGGKRIWSRLALTV